MRKIRPKGVSNDEVNSGFHYPIDLGAKARITEIENKMQSPDFWLNKKEASMISKELSDLKEEVEFWTGFESELKYYSSLNDTELEKLSDGFFQFRKRFDKQFIKIFLSGEYDSGNALMFIYSGAGGVDAQDWATILLRMYQKYCQNERLEFSILDQTLGEQGGIKNITIEIKGWYAYGYLKGESGVHRLVRISPFSSKALRHTSFALVDILPEIEDFKLGLDPKDLKVDTYRSSGAGGQNVNKVETAVRVTHLPTNTIVAVQAQRSQAQNKEKAIQILQSKLSKLMEENKIKEISELRGSMKEKEIQWGNQARSYVLNPYKLVKDHRTNVESTQPDKVLEGDLGMFIKKEIISGGRT